MITKTVAILTTATEIPAVSGYVINNGTGAVWIGGPTVTADATATGGYKLASGASIGPLPEGDIYGICAASTTATVTILQTHIATDEEDSEI